jgi:hypothetical protein
METRQRDAVHEIRTVVGSVWPAPLEGRRRIRDDGNGESEVSRHPDRTRYAVVGGDPDHYERVDSIRA